MTKLPFKPLDGGMEPVVDSPESLDQACEVLGQLERFEVTEAQVRDSKIREASQAYAERLKFVASKIDADAEKGATVSLEQYRDALMKAASDYVRNHPDEIFTGKTKTAKRPHADVQLRSSAATVGLKANTQKSDVVKKIVDTSGLVAHLDALLAKLGLTRLVRVKTELDLKAIQEDDKAGRLEDLPEGLKRIPASISVLIKPATRPAS